MHYKEIGEVVTQFYGQIRQFLAIYFFVSTPPTHTCSSSTGLSLWRWVYALWHCALCGWASRFGLSRGIWFRYEVTALSLCGPLLTTLGYLTEIYLTENQLI